MQNSNKVSCILLFPCYWYLVTLVNCPLLQTEYLNVSINSWKIQLSITYNPNAEKIMASSGKWSGFCLNLTGKGLLHHWISFPWWIKYFPPTQCDLHHYFSCNTYPRTSQSLIVNGNVCLAIITFAKLDLGETGVEFVGVELFLTKMVFLPP